MSDCASQAAALAEHRGWFWRTVCRLPGFDHRVAGTFAEGKVCAFCIRCGTVVPADRLGKG
jgi:hypothetical protein